MAKYMNISTEEDKNTRLSDTIIMEKWSKVRNDYKNGCNRPRKQNSQLYNIPFPSLERKQE
jgi:hypothetical protein